jgi:hypothetical protein
MTAPDFIEVYPDALDAVACHRLVERFEASGLAVRGETGSGVDVSLKNSWDIRLAEHPAWADAVAQLNAAVVGGLKRYLKQYAYALLAPLQLKLPDPSTGAIVQLDVERLERLDETTFDSVMGTVLRPGTINLQKYLADQGGYPYWHSEAYPKLDHGEALHRVLLWTIYLNDGFDGGETEFFYQGRRIAPRTGSLLIAPTAFTHTHRGNMPRGGDKYIATSWTLFQRAETLYGPR